MPGQFETLTFSQAEFSRICGVSEAIVSKHARAGTLPRDKEGRLTLGPALRTYAELRRVDRKVSGSAENIAARLRAVTARAELEKRRLIKLEAETLPASRVQQEYDALRALFADETANLASECQETIPEAATPAEIAQLINGIIHKMLNRIRAA
jgi:hypothetical protein